MGTVAEASFKTTSWEERTCREIDGGGRITKVTSTKTFTGEIDGESSVEYVMYYRPDGTATFAGFECVVGSVGGRSGSFVLEHTGAYEDGVAKATWRVVPGSGTGGLTTLKGTGGYASAHAESYPMTLEYEFE